MDVGIGISHIHAALSDVQFVKPIQRKLPPLSAPATSSREKELSDVYSLIETEVKQIKNDVLSSLENGGAVDYVRIKSLFEKAEFEIQEKRRHTSQKVYAKPSAISNDDFLQSNKGRKTTRKGLASAVDLTREHYVPRGERRRKITKEGNISAHKQLDLLNLRNIINPAGQDGRKLAKSLLNTTQSIVRQESLESDVKSPVKTSLKHRTGSNIAVQSKEDMGCFEKLAPLPPSSDDARKGILHLIERKMIPASASLSILPSPIKQQKILLHNPSDKALARKQTRCPYSLTLVKFDRSTLDPEVGQDTQKPLLVQRGNTLQDHDGSPLPQPHPSHMDLSFYNQSEHQLATLNTLFPSSSALSSHSHKFVIQNGRLCEDSQDFIHFKHFYCLTWESISKLLSMIVKLLSDYSVPIAFIDGTRLADMSLYFEVGPKPTMKDLLICVINSNDVEKIIRIPGQRYLAADGDHMAAICIQSIWRGHRHCKVYREERRKKTAASLIALNWIMTCKRTYMRKHLQHRKNKYLEGFRARFSSFKKDWPRIKVSKRVIVHIPSLGYPVSIRKNVSNISALQNFQIGRICDIVDPNVEVLYVCPLEMDGELHSYYEKLVLIMCEASGQGYQNVSSRLKMLTPENLTKFLPHNLCLSSLLKYSDYLLQRIRNLIKGKEAYIVPGHMHSDDLYVADKLGIPILGTEPDIAQLYSLKSGAHRIFESVNVQTGPREYDIYTQQQLEEALAKLIIQNLHINRWLFKIDNNFDGRGTAFCDVTPHLLCYNFAEKEAARYAEKWKEKWAYENVYNLVLKELPSILERYGSPVDKKLFRGWREFLEEFLREGGIIEAAPPAESVTGLTGNVLIEPTGDIKVLSVADQIHSVSPYKCWGHTVPQASFDTSILNGCILSISQACRSRGIVGYLSIDFVTFIDPELEEQQLWAVGLQIGYSNSSAIINVLTALTNGNLNADRNKFEVTVHKTLDPPATYVSKRKRTSMVKEKMSEIQNRYAVVSPNLIHSNLNNIHYNVFFQICKAHGIAYDERSKIGTAFMLMSNSNRDLLGMITMAESLHDAVAMFALNLVTMHNDISTPNMSGKNNFQGALDDLRSILESLKINLQIDHEKYPTMDPKDRRLVHSASKHRDINCDEDEERSKSAEGSQEEIPAKDILLQQFSEKLVIDHTCARISLHQEEDIAL